MKVADLQRTAVFPRIQPGNAPQTTQRHNVQPGKVPAGKTFGQVLTESVKENQPVRFSAHAIRRLEERQLSLNDRMLERLDQGIRQLDAKGSRNSVVFMDQMAFVVSVKNKTVVTAVGMDQTKENIFTNIDSVAIV